MKDIDPLDKALGSALRAVRVQARLTDGQLRVSGPSALLFAPERDGSVTIGVR